MFRYFVFIFYPLLFGCAKIHIQNMYSKSIKPQHATRFIDPDGRKKNQINAGANFNYISKNNFNDGSYYLPDSLMEIDEKIYNINKKNLNYDISLSYTKYFKSYFFGANYTSSIDEANEYFNSLNFDVGYFLYLSKIFDTFYISYTYGLSKNLFKVDEYTIDTQIELVIAPPFIFPGTKSDTLEHIYSGTNYLDYFGFNLGFSNYMNDNVTLIYGSSIFLIDYFESDLVENIMEEWFKTLFIDVNLAFSYRGGPAYLNRFPCVYKWKSHGFRQLL